MKKILIPVFCLFHLFAISWWSLPRSFGNLVLSENNQNVEDRIFQALTVLDKTWIQSLLTAYVNLTGSQQYWDFFAPRSTRLHQYLSVCDSIETKPEAEIITCQDRPLFTNLPDNISEFQALGSNRSRWYRLSENLIALNDPMQINAFARYYQVKNNGAKANTQAYVIAHQFELNPGLESLPKPGYRTDKLLLALP